ncbi:hypothetical protein [Microbacterium dextranolyticum]|uniref:ABC-2 type transport system permease protein n=1 Tax=Microbacterium dextranolyticum TaxID=36806 RepID=A0A9W6HM94_9MICO|nr:hypothetical protein [Microbacterium dextranolyticum]MBM7463246.1 ABC-2 type transport system permease protein [Microbacterium dextranolyticum]GLJ95648.1 hypothetical protein GCM10017591_17110 [Microbacterium dextranolyticum]
MVAHVLRLRLDLLVGALRGAPRRTVRSLIGVACVVVAVVGVFLATARLQGSSDGTVDAVAVIAGSALTGGLFAAALVGGLDDQLDPRRFSVLGMSPASVAGSVLLAGVISVPVWGLIAVTVAVGALWRSHGASAPITVLAGALSVLTCVLAIRVGLALASLVLRVRRSRELSGLFIVALLIVVVPVAVFFVSLDWDGQVPSALADAVRLLSMTPLGASWAIPGASLTGSFAGPVVVAVLTVLGLGALWMWLVRVLLTTTERPSSGRERAGLGWFALTPGTPAGGVAARSLIYWLRDPRYLVNLIIVPIAAIVVVAPLLVVGVPVSYIALIPAPLMALFFGWIAHNDLAYDSTALWMHVASGVRGTSDRIGRLIPVIVIAIAVLAVAIPISTSFHGRWAVLPALIGVCASLFLCGLGLSSLSSALAPYAVSRPGDSPFQQPQRTSGGLAQGAVIVGALVLSVPALWWAWRSLGGDEASAWIALWGGSAIGLVVLVGGVFAGGAVFDRSGGRLMEFVEST